MAKKSDMGLILTKAKMQGFFPDVPETELDILSVNARNMFAEDPTFEATEVIDVRKWGATGDGTTDDWAAFNQACIDARATGKSIYVPKGTYLLGQTLDVSGVEIYGDYRGYLGSGNGTVIKGPGSGTVFKQMSLTGVSLQMKLRGMRIINCTTGIELRYTVYSVIEDICVKDALGDGIIFGDNTVFGPLFNQMIRVVSNSLNGRGIVIGGKDWCNHNIFYNCDFKGKNAPGVEMNSVGGYGALNNIFDACEIHGTDQGAKLSTLNANTQFKSCFFESTGPSLWLSGSSGVSLKDNVYGTLTNTNPTGKPHFIHHEAGTARIRIDGGWCTSGTTAEFNDLRFVGSDLTASLFLHYIFEPATNNIQATGFKMHDEMLISAQTRVYRGNVTVQRGIAPTFTIQYADGSRPFVIKRNGTQGGSDFGVQFQNNGVTVAIIDNLNRMNFQTDIGTNMSVAATTPGTVVRKLAIRDLLEQYWGIFRFTTLLPNMGRNAKTR